MMKLFYSKAFLPMVAALSFTAPMRAAHLNAPLWDVYVVDAAGHPVVGITVTEDYKDYSCEANPHLESLVTDAIGHVQFPYRFEKRNPFRCAKETTANLGAGAHASLGRHPTVWVGGYRQPLNGYAVDQHNFVVDWTGSPKHMTSTIVARKEEEWKRHIEEEKATPENLHT